METRINGSHADKVVKKFGWDGVFRVDLDRFAGVIWVFWECNIWQVNIISHCSQVVHMKFNDGKGMSWYFSACYGRPQRVLRERLWLSLKNFANSIDGPWLVAGDFNAVLHDGEVMGSSSSSARRCSAFADCIEVCDLQDVGFQGPPYTWKRNSLRECLDRVLVNKMWLEKNNVLGYCSDSMWFH